MRYVLRCQHDDRDVDDDNNNANADGHVYVCGCVGMWWVRWDGCGDVIGTESSSRR